MRSQTIKPKKVISFLFNQRHAAPFSSIAMLVAQSLFVLLSNVVAPIFVAKLLALIASGNTSLAGGTNLLIFYAATLIMGDVIMARLAMLFIYLGETKMQASLARQMFDSISKKDLTFHANNMSGEVIANSTKLNNALEGFWDLLTFTAVPILTTFLAVTVVLMFIFWQYAVIIAAVSIIIAAFIARSQSKVSPISRQTAQRSSKITGYFADVVTNMTVVRAFAQEKTERKNYDNVVDMWHKTVHQEMWKVLKTTGQFSVITAALNVLAFFVAIVAAQKQLANIATIYLVVSYTLSMAEQLWSINRVTRNYLRIVGNAAPMIAMIEVPTEINDPEAPKHLMSRRGEVQFNNVTFSYPDNPNEVLFKNLNLKIKPGEKIGLVGKSGGGKTTLSKLVLRFMNLQEGCILIDGQAITEISQNELRSAIAYVPQEPLLFHRTVRENIGYSKDDIFKGEIEAVAKMANADEFIASLPNGYETLVGERGVKLSGGQRQRIAIARAMLKNSPILLLDEATSALDSESEALIQGALWKLMEGRTAIVIAHRLSTIQKMDRIIVLDNGKIVEQGSHKELTHQNGIYADLWNRQSGGFLED